MRKIELHISEAAFRRLRSETMVRSMANCGDVQDILHAVCVRIVKSKGDAPVVIKLKREEEECSS